MKDLTFLFIIFMVIVFICLIKMSTSTHGINNIEEGGYPTYRKRIWYNAYAYMRSSYLTLINVDDKGYSIKPYVGLQLPTISKDGTYAIYEITKVIDDSYGTSSDYLYANDAYFVDVRLVKIVN